MALYFNKKIGLKLLKAAFVSAILFPVALPLTFLSYAASPVLTTFFEMLTVFSAFGAVVLPLAGLFLLAVLPTPYDWLPNNCLRCGYSREGIGDRPCPECGTPPSKK